MGTLHEDICIFMISHLIREIFQTKFVVRVKTLSIFNNFFPKIVPFMR